MRCCATSTSLLRVFTRASRRFRSSGSAAGVTVADGGVGPAALEGGALEGGALAGAALAGAALAGASATAVGIAIGADEDGIGI